MGINITEISQKVLDNNTNAANVFRKMYDLHYNPNPLDVPFEYIDENGNKITTTIKNQAGFRKKVWDDVGAALGQFNKLIYVDAENGDDSNDGSEATPFKTIQKAINSIPIGGVARIYLLSSNNILNEYINIESKKIFFVDKTENSDANITFTHWVDSEGYAHIRYMSLRSSVVNLSGIEVKTDLEDGDNIDANAGVLFLFLDGFNQITGYNTNYNVVTNHVVSIYPNTGIIGSVGIISGELNGKIYKSFIHLHNGASCHLQFYSSDNNATDADGNTSILIDGIIKDVDSGNPLNVLSNVNFSD